MEGYILGISCGYHDSAAALIKDGEVLGACEEERFTGIKHDSSFPVNTINWLYDEFKIEGSDIQSIAFYDNPKKKLKRIEKSVKRSPLIEYFNRKKIIRRNKVKTTTIEIQMRKITHKNVDVFYGDHHLSHVAYSYYTSPYERASILSIDGVGEFETTTLYYAENNRITKLQQIDFPHSLGMLYSTLTAFLGFKPNDGEYKVMGLAPYGNPKKHLDKFRKLYKTLDDGSFEIDMQYFTYDWSDTHMFNWRLGSLFGIPNRLPEGVITQDHKDLAATLQHEYEYLLGRLVDRVFALRASNVICLSGGCAYNGTANGKILANSNFKQIWIPPAPSDSGSAIGAALHLYHYNGGKKRPKNTSPYLGPHYTNNVVELELDKFKEEIYFVKKNHSELIPIISKEITEGNVIGWFEGRMEFGARALGNRSILANPCDPQMKARLNRLVKKREGFRPFAPIVKVEEQTKYFKYDKEIPYMNQVVTVLEEHRKSLPAITHVDGSARVQSLTYKQHNRMYKLLEQLNIDNGYPMVLNTSFNLKDQTMVLDPKSAIETFLNCEMDTLVINNFIIKKNII
jgi:carbamoyltransferase|tara:strand:- start:227 stop:1933 length:1707 start_codon:yes stop_codon:yes gene_type:complete